MPWRRRRKYSTAELVSAVDSLHLSQQVTVPLWSSPPDLSDAVVTDFDIFHDTSEVLQTSEHSPLFNLFPDQENVSPVASNETELREQRLNEERILTNLSMEVDGESARSHLRRRFPLRRVRLPVVSTSETVHQRAGLFSRPRSIPQASWSEPIIFTAEIHPSWRVSWDRLVNTHAPLSKNER
ncbi:hypothetical protein TRVA0_044S00100 [Trichomonascus vanleenenianus]|uniref:uncharacterized protein n=1 Tax=Trichomonascus vanleenenianus TaxID=2268995 RepID=UPI003ECB0CF2